MISNKPQNSHNQGELPPNWPTEVTFLSSSSLPSPRLPQSFSTQFCSPSPLAHPSNPSHPTRTVSMIQIQPITASTASIKPAQHPAKGQFGLFATKDISPRTFILPYLGIVHLEDESDENSEYDLRVWGEGENGEKIPLGIEATQAGSAARFCNDYRGILPRANTFFEEYSIPTSSHTIRGLALISGAHVIKKGTEFCVSYGKGFWEARKKNKVEGDEDLETTSDASPKKDGASNFSSNSSDSKQKTSSSTPSEIKAQLERQRARLAMFKKAA